MSLPIIVYGEHECSPAPHTSDSCICIYIYNLRLSIQSIYPSHSLRSILSCSGGLASFLLFPHWWFGYQPVEFDFLRNNNFRHLLPLLVVMSIDLVCNIFLRNNLLTATWLSHSPSNIVLNEVITNHIGEYSRIGQRCKGKYKIYQIQ